LVSLAFALAIIANLAILMFYYWGQLDDPIVARLALPFSVVLVAAIGWTVFQLVRTSTPGAAISSLRRAAGWISAGGAVAAYLWSGILANEQQNRRNTLADELAWETRYVEAMPPGERLVITNKSALPWMLRRIPAITVSHARRNVERLERQMDHSTFRDLLVTQDYRATSAAGDFRLDPADHLPSWIVLETVAEKRFGAHLDRISRVVAIKPPPPRVATTEHPSRIGAQP
jgi:hypothetical protein